MESAFAWIGQIVAWFGQFCPRWVILDTTEGAIKYVRGSRVVVCTSGIHWFWPATTKLYEYPTARQVDRLETQTIESRDGKTFIVSATITYVVTDLKAHVTNAQSAMVAMTEISMGAVHDVCCDYTWADLQEAQRKGTIKTQLRHEAQKQLKDWGVMVLKVQLNTLARCRVLKVSQSTASEEN